MVEKLLMFHRNLVLPPSGKIMIAAKSSKTLAVSKSPQGVTSQKTEEFIKTAT